MKYIIDKKTINFRETTIVCREDTVFVELSREAYDQFLSTFLLKYVFF